MYYILPQAIRYRTRTNVGLLAYVFSTFSLGTVTLACNARLAQLMFVNNRTYPGGPSAWLSSHTEDAINVLGTVSYMLCVFLADGLLVSECLLACTIELCFERCSLLVSVALADICPVGFPIRNSCITSATLSR